MSDVVEAADLRLDALDLAPWLLNKVLELDDAAVRIVEVEAYGSGDDAASHADRGPTERNRDMFEPGGTLYVYLVYGMHLCANVVSGPPGDGQAVLLRAGEPLRGEDAMMRRRPVDNRAALCSGPAKLTQALGITLEDGGARLSDPCSRLRLVDDGTEPPAEPRTGPRVGISSATRRPWRFWVPESPWVSRP